MSKKQTLTRGTIKLIKEVILITALIKAKYVDTYEYNNRYTLCDILCEIVSDRYHGRSLDYQLGRMNLTKTGNILDAIDLFLYRYPEYITEFELNFNPDDHIAEYDQSIKRILEGKKQGQYAENI